MSKVKSFLISHTLVALYGLILVTLMYGSYQTSGDVHLKKIMIHAGSLLLFYIIFTKLRSKIQGSKFNLQVLFGYLTLPSSLPKWLTMISILQIVIHFVILRGSPAISALDLNDIGEVAELRRSITANSSLLLGYLSSINLKGIIPFLILYLLYKKEYKLYYLLLVLSSFYGFSLMQKSYIVSLLLPSLIYVTINLKWWYIIKHVSIIVTVIVGLVIISNPSNPSNPSNKSTPKIDGSSSEKNVKSDLPMVNILSGIKHRILVIPGEMVSEWFEHIPKNKPFLYGDGYRLLAKARGREFHKYSHELYPYIRPQYVAQGLTGSVNVASFMYDYANFGKYGLVLGGFLIAFLLSLIEFLFIADFKFKLCFNFFPVLILSSTALTTILFSGGWLFIIVMYFLFLHIKQDEQVA
jgi:hypothetical protein